MAYIFMFLGFCVLGATLTTSLGVFGPLIALFAFVVVLHLYEYFFPV